MRGLFPNSGGSLWNAGRLPAIHILPGIPRRREDNGSLKLCREKSQALSCNVMGIPWILRNAEYPSPALDDRITDIFIRKMLLCGNDNAATQKMQKSLLSS